MANKKISELIETESISNDDILMIVQDGTNKKIKAKNLITNNSTSEYLELVGDDNETYRAVIKNKQIHVYNSKVHTAPIPNVGDNTFYDGLIINKMYGTGEETSNIPVSHSFVELYNMKNTEVNLKGLYLWYKPLDGTWEKLELQGIIPPYHSFLIRGLEHAEKHNDFVRCYLDDYDMEWDIKFSNDGFSIYLCIGGDIPEVNPIRFSKNEVTGDITWTNGRYIDLLGCGSSSGASVTAYETRFLTCMNERTGVIREDFANSGNVNIGTNKAVYGNNEADCVPIDYSSCDIEKYKPRGLKNGEWDIFYDKPKLKDSYPNFITICYGENGDTSRTFTWQSKITDEGYLKYRKKDDPTWLKKETSKRMIRHKTEDATIHSVIINNLTPGVYEYQCGEEGKWSDVETFEVKTYNESTPIKMLLTTDEQGWSSKEYDACKVASKFIEDNETFDFHMNCGDISQNANRYFEWLYYYNYYKTNKNVCHQITCGNNDLISKKYSDAFAYYSTHENQRWNSVHAWDLGFVHYVCLNSNTDYTYVNGDGSVGGYVNTDAFLQAQCTWLDEHLTAVAQRSTKPRWVICYMHLSPFTVGRTKRLQRFISIFEKHKVDLVLCGHNHAYSKSKALYTGYDFNINSAYNDYVTKVAGSSDLKIVDELNKDGAPINRTEDIANGTYYVLAQATSFKLSGKETPITLPDNLKGTIHDNGQGSPWWISSQSTPPQPSYITAEFGWNSINLKMYYIENILERDSNGNVSINPYSTRGNKTQSKYLFDTLTIEYSSRNK